MNGPSGLRAMVVRSRRSPGTNDEHEPHSVYLVGYHIIWCPKWRRKALVGPIRTRLGQIIREVATEHEWTVIDSDRR
jgi:REP element-mobilizing transposase RayT